MQADTNDTQPASFWARILGVRRGELPLLAWAGAYHFALLFAYYLLRPLRETFGIRGEWENLRWLWTGTTAAMLVAAPLYAWLVSRLPRRRFVPLVYLLAAACIAVFWVAFLAFSARPGEAGDPHLALGYAFYIWLSVFNLFAVTVLWGFLSDVFTREQGARLFAAVGAGGTLGAVAGSAVPAWLLGDHDLFGVRFAIEPLTLLLPAIVVLVATAGCARVVARLAGVAGEAHFDAAPPVWRPGPEPNRRAWEGIARIARSPYLQLLLGYMLLYTLTSSHLYFEQARIVKESLTSQVARTEFFGQLDFWTNVLALAMQFLVTGRLLVRTGVGIGLAVLPLATIGAFAALSVSPLPMTLLWVQVVRRGLHYAVDRPAREVLYTVLGPEEQYKAKGFIDTVAYRAGDLLGAWTAGIVASAAGLAALVAVCGAWLATGIGLTRAHERRRGRAAGAKGEVERRAETPAG